MSTFKIGDSVRKKSGSSWEGRIVGTYITELTPEGYAVESFAHKGSVQIYPVNALEALAEQPSVRKPLSDEQICETLERERMKWSSRAGPPTYEFATAFARAIEAAHGIGVKGEA